jgi:hypothetical protein
MFSRRSVLGRGDLYRRPCRRCRFAICGWLGYVGMRPVAEAVKRKLQPPVGRSAGVPVQGLKSGRSDERLDDL